MNDTSASPLSDLARIRAVQTRSISPENPTGAPGAGGRAIVGSHASAARDLGPGWKISPAVEVDAGQVFELGRIDEPGLITHLWITTHPDHWRTLVLRAFWDGASEPAVEVPLGDFFCNGWGRFAQVSSILVAANPHGGFNSYWPMPFSSGARITLENTSEQPAVVFYQLTYEVGGDYSDLGYFHAQWRRSNPLEYATPHVLLDGIEGAGQFVGAYIAWGSHSDGWWGEGEIKFYLDDDQDFPTINGTGTEDYFGGAWNFELPGEGYATYTTPYLGLVQVSRPDGLYASQQRFGMYRWHVADPIHFRTKLRVDIQALGWRSGWRYLPLRDDIASMALFYLDEPATRRPPTPTFDLMEVHTGSEGSPDLGATPPRQWPGQASQ